jgi:hypothetical protein
LLRGDFVAPGEYKRGLISVRLLRLLHDCSILLRRLGAAAGT